MLPAPIPDDENERLASLQRMLLLSTPSEEAFERVTRTAQRLFKTPIALLSLINEKRQWFKSSIGLPVRETGRDVSFCGHAIMQDETFVIENARLDPRFADNPLVTGASQVVFYAGQPVKNADGYRVGTLCVIDHEARSFGPEDRRALDDLGHWVEQIFLCRQLGEAEKEMLSELDEARRNGMLDPMLNLWHHGAILELLEREAQRAMRTRSPLSVMMIDIDHFKDINDQFGHPAADAVLIEFTKRMRSATRAYDSIGRYGGDEFMIILPDTDETTAQTVAERLLKAAELAPVAANDASIYFSISIGCATADYRNDVPEPLQLLQRADNALLNAKRNGRGRMERHCP